MGLLSQGKEKILIMCAKEEKWTVDCYLLCDRESEERQLHEKWVELETLLRRIEKVLND